MNSYVNPRSVLISNLHNFEGPSNLDVPYSSKHRCVKHNETLSVETTLQIVDWSVEIVLCLFTHSI